MTLKIEKHEMPNNIMVMIKLMEYYPDRLAVVPIDNTEAYEGNNFEPTGWGCSVCRLDPVNRILGETIYAFDNFNYPTQDIARRKMERVLEEVKKAITAMSN